MKFSEISVGKFLKIYSVFFQKFLESLKIFCCYTVQTSISHYALIHILSVLYVAKQVRMVIVIDVAFG